MSHDDLPSASTMECIGLAVDSLDDLQGLLDATPSRELGRDGRVRLRRFHDGSGSVVQAAFRRRSLLNLTPALAAEPGARVSSVRLVEGGAVADVVDSGGEVVARIFPTGRTGAAPAEVRAKFSGILAARHFSGLVKPGDCVAVMAAVS